jgi:hypothetical protein
MRIVGSNTGTSRRAYDMPAEYCPVLLQDAGSNPSVHVWGCPISAPLLEGEASTIYAVKENTASIGSYGERTMEIDNPFISNYDYAEWMAEYLLHYYGTIRPRLENVEIMGDPRLEIGDRVTVVDAAESTGINTECWIMGVDYDEGPPYKQRLKLAQADKSNFLILDDPVNGKLDLNILAF